MLFPNWFYFNLYEMSAWTRSIVVPLAIVWAFQPAIPCPRTRRSTSFSPTAGATSPSPRRWRPTLLISWTTFFLMWDSVFKGHGRPRRPLDSRLVPAPGRGLDPRAPAGLRRPRGHLPRHRQHDHGDEVPRLPDTDPAWWPSSRSSTASRFPGEDSTRCQPSRSPVWDTAITMIALAESGLERHTRRSCRPRSGRSPRRSRPAATGRTRTPTARRAAGTSSSTTPSTPTWTTPRWCCWPCATSTSTSPTPRSEKAFLRGLNWLLCMQSVTGGWAAFDKENTKAILDKIPFADHNAMIDPPTPDITARVLELLGYIGYDGSYPGGRQGDRASSRPSRRPTAPGTAAGASTTSTAPGRSLRGLAAIGEDMNQPFARRAASWLKSVQLRGRRLGRDLRDLPRPVAQGQGPVHPVADRLGHHGPHGRRRLWRRPWSAASNISSPLNAPTAPGTKPSLRARASPRFTTSSTRCTAITSLFRRWDIYRKGRSRGLGRTNFRRPHLWPCRCRRNCRCSISRHPEDEGHRKAIRSS